MVIWERRMLGYHHPGGQHPMNPLRRELTWQFAEALGVVDGYTVVTPGPADVATSGLVPHPGLHRRGAPPLSTGFPGLWVWQEWGSAKSTGIPRDRWSP